MTVLAIETATTAAATALADEGGLLAAIELRAGRRHVELLHVGVLTMLETAGVDFAELTGVAVDIGPGLFTGIRVGVAAAKGYAMALGLPVVAFTSLQILRLACEAAGQMDAVGVVDLRRGEVAWSLPAALGEPPKDRHGPPHELAAELAAYLARLDAHGRPDDRAVSGGPHDGLVLAGDGLVLVGDGLVLAGDGARRYGELLTAAVPGRLRLAGGELAVPPVASLALSAVVELAAGGGIDPAEVRPVYLRDADVRINWTTRHDAPGRQVEVA
jgi:tRNA threonylcarbamoyladenosine biosynthesis protein TsaB